MNKNTVPGTHSRVTPVEPSHITKPCRMGVTRVDKVTRIAPVLHGHTTQPMLYRIWLCVSALGPQVR